MAVFNASLAVVKVLAIAFKTIVFYLRPLFLLGKARYHQIFCYVNLLMIMLFLFQMSYSDCFSSLSSHFCGLIGLLDKHYSYVLKSFTLADYNHSYLLILLKLGDLCESFAWVELSSKLRFAALSKETSCGSALDYRCYYLVSSFSQNCLLFDQHYSLLSDFQ